MAKKAKEWRSVLTKAQLRYVESCISLNKRYGEGSVRKVSPAVETVVTLVDILDGNLAAPKAETEIVEAFNVDTVIADFNAQLGLDDDDDSGSDNGG